jgi:hypothetical protein
LEIDWRTGDGCLDLNEFIDQMCWHTPFQIRELMPMYEFKKAHRREVVLKSGLRRDFIDTMPGLQGRSQKESTRDRRQQPYDSNSCHREKPKHESVLQRAKDSSSEMGKEDLVSKNLDEPSQRIKLKTSPGVDGLSESEVHLISEADNPVHCLMTHTKGSCGSMLSSKSLNTMKAPRDPSRNSRWNSRNGVLKSIPGNSMPRLEFVHPENSNVVYDDWDPVGNALKKNDSTFNVKNMSRTGLWPAKPTLRNRSNSDVNSRWSRNQSLSVDTPKKVILSPVLNLFCGLQVVLPIF